MQTTSSTWKSLLAGGAAYLETSVTIAGVQYGAFSAPVVTRAMMENGLSVGNAAAAMLEFSLIPIPSLGVPIADRFIVNTLAAAGTGYAYTANLPKSAQVALKMRLNDGATASEWLPAGTYYISRRSTDPITGLVTLRCFDAMLKAEELYPVAAQMTMQAAVTDIAQRLGVSVDARTVIHTGTDYAVTPNDGTLTMRDVLGGIAAAHGGNWIITPANELRLVPLASAADAAGAAVAVDVEAVLNPLALSETKAISGLRVKQGDTETIYGDETGIVLDVNCPYMTAGIAADLQDMIVGMTYQPYSLPTSVYDPAAELGDYLRSKSDIASILCAETVTYDLACRGNLTAPELGEVQDEYPYIGNNARILSEARGYADEAASEAAEALSASLTQEDVFNRLTNNGAAQGLYLDPNTGDVYISATYIKSGYLSASRIQGGTLELGGANNTNGTVAMKGSDGSVTGTWDNSGINIVGADTPLQCTFTDTEGNTFDTKLYRAGLLCDTNILTSGTTNISVTNVGFYASSNRQATKVMLYLADTYNGSNNHTAIYPNRIINEGGEDIDVTGNLDISADNIAITVNNAFTVNGKPVGSILATGTYDGGTVAAGARGTATISLGYVGTTNYMVLLNSAIGDISCGAQNKTATSFDLYYRNNDTSARPCLVTWAIIKTA